MAAASALAVETVSSHTPQPMGSSIKKLLAKIGLKTKKSSAESVLAFTTTTTMLGYVEHARTFKDTATIGDINQRRLRALDALAMVVVRRFGVVAATDSAHLSCLCSNGHGS